MKTEKIYIVMSYYAMRNNNIGLAILDTAEEAIQEAENELKAEYVTEVRIYEADKASRIFFGRQILKNTKRIGYEKKL